MPQRRDGVKGAQLGVVSQIGTPTRTLAAPKTCWYTAAISACATRKFASTPALLEGSHR
jgi:hypothetical protein